MNTRILTLPLLALASYALASCSQEDGHEGHDDHSGHDHAARSEAHDDHAAHADAGEHDHAHATDAGPNGGRVILATEPHVEFLVTNDRKVLITALDEELKGIPVGDLIVSVIGGERSDPTRLTFVPQGDSLISDVPLPQGNDFPVVLQIKARPDAEQVTERFNVNLSECPTCDYLEYACVCEHADGE